MDARVRLGGIGSKNMKCRD